MSVKLNLANFIHFIFSTKRQRIIVSLKDVKSKCRIKLKVQTILRNVFSSRQRKTKSHRHITRITLPLSMALELATSTFTFARMSVFRAGGARRWRTKPLVKTAVTRALMSVLLRAAKVPLNSMGIAGC